MINIDTKKCLNCEKRISVNSSSNYCSSLCGFKCKPVEWNNERALVVGLVASDGYLCKDRARIGFVSKYKYFALNFKILVNSTNKITTNKQGEFSRSVINITDYSLYNFLIKIGLTPKKSLTISKIDIPNNLEIDYFWLVLRGIIEGDGCISNSITISSGSKSFLEWIKGELSNRKISCSIHIDRTSFILRVPVAYSSILYEKMYKNYENIKLESKLITFNDIKHKHKEQKLKELSLNECIDCKKNIHLQSKRCSDCNDKLLRITTKIEWPEITSLVNRLKNSNYSKLSKEIGVSDNAIRKHLLKNGINPKTLKSI